MANSTCSNKKQTNKKPQSNQNTTDAKQVVFKLGDTATKQMCRKTYIQLINNTTNHMDLFSPKAFWTSQFLACHLKVCGVAVWQGRILCVGATPDKALLSHFTEVPRTRLPMRNKVCKMEYIGEGVSFKLHWSQSFRLELSMKIDRKYCSLKKYWSRVVCSEFQLPINSLMFGFCTTYL